VALADTDPQGGVGLFLAKSAMTGEGFQEFLAKKLPLDDMDFRCGVEIL
jgi:hypothetical protein